MIKRKLFLIVCSLLFVVLPFSCYTENRKDRGGTGIFNILKTRRLKKELYDAVWGRQVDWLKEILATGIDPNFCRGECGWADSNPLNVLAERINGTYPYYGAPVQNPVPDVIIFQLLINAGADVNMRPYVWDIVYFYSNDIVDKTKRYRKQVKESLEVDDVNEQIRHHVSDINRILQCFLAAGANPDKLGHPYPFSIEAMEAKIDDKQANKYFSKGTRAINVAIEKGILWESQVDLLLQYTNLDEESLKAAERSNDPAMIEKINKLWEIQQNLNAK